MCDVTMYETCCAGQKIGGRCKQGAIIFYGSQVVADFVPKFVAMATGVGSSVEI